MLLFMSKSKMERSNVHQMQNRCSKMYMKLKKTRMWANAQPDGRPAEHRWRPLFNAAKFG